MFVANGASDGSATCTLWRWFLGAGGISHRPCSSQVEMRLEDFRFTPPHPHLDPVHLSTMESQLHQHGPQLLLRDVLSSIPLPDLLTQPHADAALVLPFFGCLLTFLHELLLRSGSKRLSQTLRFEVIQPLPLGLIPLSLRRGLAQPVNEGHGFNSMRILRPRKSGCKGLGQKKAHMTVEKHQSTSLSTLTAVSFFRFFKLQRTKTVPFQCQHNLNSNLSQLLCIFHVLSPPPNLPGTRDSLPGLGTCHGIILITQVANPGQC